jgi:glycogen debranching enzyme
VKPGADIVTLSNSVKDSILTLRENNVLVFCGGANDISKNNTKEGLRHISNFVRSTIHTNIVLLGISFRHDLVNWSCINKEISTFNRKLYTIMKGHRHVTVTNYDLNRQLFTRHGMHLNKTRKEIIAKHITETCITIFQTKQNLVPICMSWKEIEEMQVKELQKEEESQEKEKECVDLKEMEDTVIKEMHAQRSQKKEEACGILRDTEDSIINEVQVTDIQEKEEEEVNLNELEVNAASEVQVEKLQEEEEESVNLNEIVINEMQVKESQVQEEEHGTVSEIEDTVLNRLEVKELQGKHSCVELKNNQLG